MLCGASEGFILLVPTRFTEVHISSPVPSMCLRAKDHLEGTKVAVFPRYCAPQKVQTGSAAAGGHRRVATRETTGDLATRRGAGDPETRAEWMKVLRYGHLRSAPVVVDVVLPTEWNHPTPRILVGLHALRRLLDGLPPLRDEGDRHFPVVTAWFDKYHGPELCERCRTFPGPAGSFAIRLQRLRLLSLFVQQATSTSTLLGRMVQAMSNALDEHFDNEIDLASTESCKAYKALSKVLTTVTVP